MSATINANVTRIRAALNQLPAGQYSVDDLCQRLAKIETHLLSLERLQASYRQQQVRLHLMTPSEQPKLKRRLIRVADREAAEAIDQERDKLKDKRARVQLLEEIITTMARTLCRQANDAVNRMRRDSLSTPPWATGVDSL